MLSPLLALAIAAPIKVAVMPLAAGEGLGERVVRSISEAAVAEIRRRPEVKVVTPQEIAALLSLEKQKAAFGCQNDACFAEIGGALGVDRMVTGDLALLGRSWMVHLRLIDVAKVQVLMQADRRIKGGTVDDVLDALPGLAQELFPRAALLESSRQADLSSSLAAYYPFSGDVNDRSKHALNGVNHGATPTTDRMGKPNSAYYFNGSAYVDVPGGAALNGMSSFTLAAWIKADVQNQGVILSKVDPNRDFALALSTVAGGSVNAHFAHSAAYYHCWAASPKVPAGTWTHLAAVWTGRSWQLYINGSLAQERTVTTGEVPLWTGTLLQIGILDGLRSTTFRGAIDEVRIYGRSLSSSEIGWVMQQ